MHKKAHVAVMLGVVFVLTTLLAGIASATEGSSSYNDPIVRTEFDFTAELDAGDVVMNWEPYAPEGFNYYKVVRSTSNSDPVYPEDGYIEVSTDAIFDSYTDTDVPDGTVYYRICSIAAPDRYCSPVVTIENEDGDDEEEETNEDDTTLSLTAKDEEGTIKLSWSIDGTASDGFKVLKSTVNQNPTYPVMEGDAYVYLNDASKRGYEDTDVEAGETYYYRVCKYDGAGTCLAYSNNVSITMTGSTEANSFSDTATNPYKNSIEYVKEAGIVNGYPDGTYKPEADISRGEFTKILINAKFDNATITNCITENGLTEVFPDVPITYDFANYICVAKVNGIIIGYEDGTYKPDRNISFIETAKIVVNVFNVPVGAEGSAWYTHYVMALQDNNYIPPTLSNLNENVNRGEMAELVWRVKEHITTQSSVDLL